MLTEKLRVLCLASGGGTTIRAIKQAINHGKLKRVELVGAIMSRKSSLRDNLAADELTLPTFYLSELSGSNLAEKILNKCKMLSVDVLSQNGWTIKTPVSVLNWFRSERTGDINQHCGPIDHGRPDFGGKGMFGLRVHCAVLHWVRQLGLAEERCVTEAVAQQVGTEYDTGEVLKREEIPIHSWDTPQSLQQRLLTVEHDVQIAALDAFAQNEVKICQRENPLVDVSAGEMEVLVRAKETAGYIFPQG